MKQQILCINGGNTFPNYEEYLEYLKNYQIDLNKLKNGNWKEALEKDLGENYEVILPRMPSSQNAKYIEWKIWFENFFPFIQDDIILIGTSLGGLFLAKYLSENKFPVKISQVHLVAAVFDENSKEFLGDFTIPASLEMFANQANKIFLYHSKDDLVVPVAEIEKYSQKLPSAEKIILDGRGHFNRELTIPELIERIRNNL